MNTPNEALQGPMSGEAEFAATLEALNATPEPAGGEQEPQGQEPRQTTQDERPRDEQGRFVQRADAAQGRAPVAGDAPAEPFEGFSSLPPDMQERFRGISTRAERAERERNSFRDRFSRANQLAEQLRRQQSASQGSGRQAPQPSRGSGQQAQPGIAQARADVAAMPAGAERAEATRKLDAWEKHAREFPEDAAAIQQLVGGLRDEILGAVGPELEQLRQMRAEIEGFRTVAEQYQHERQQRQNHDNQSAMDELAPDWRYDAGWVDENGQEVPREERQWSGRFQAWLDGHDPEIRQFKLQQLGHGSPHVAAEVFQAFYADLAAVTAGQEQQANPNAARRQEALRDVVPTGGRNAGAAPWRSNPTPEDELEAATRFLEARRNRS